MKPHHRNSLWQRLLHRLTVIAGSAGLTLVFFLALPLIQAITKLPTGDLIVRTVDAGSLPPPPPPPPEEEPEKEEEPEEKPPELDEKAPPLDLSQLELLLNPGAFGGFGSADLGARLDTLMAASGGGDGDALFSLSDLDQKPMPTYQPGPNMDAELRRKAPGTVYVLFVVDQSGRVENPTVQSSTDPVFERPALAAVRKWRFEPGKRSGKPVRFRMRVPITFPKSPGS